MTVTVCVHPLDDNTTALLKSVSVCILLPRCGLLPVTVLFRVDILQLKNGMNRKLYDFEKLILMTNIKRPEIILQNVFTEKQ